MNIFPSPCKIEKGQGAFSFENEVVLSVSDSVKNPNAPRLFCELWNQFTAGTGTIKIQRVQTAENTAYLTRNGGCRFQDKQTDFDYEIHAGEQGVLIFYKEEQGLIHAFSALLQMIQFESIEGECGRFCIPCCEIYDRPAVQFRGIHLCVFPETTRDFLKKAVRLAGLAKYSHIIIEFWGTLKFDALPELAWENACTKAEIKPIIDDAHGFGMEVIPMFNHLGHATQSRVKYGRHVVLDQNPKLQLLFEPDGWTWCLSNPSALKLLRSIRRELIELCGPGRYFHLGCDEAYSFATCPLCSRKNGNELLLNYLNGLAEELKEQGRIPIIWGDALLDHDAWDSPYIATSRSDQRTHEILDKLDKSIIINDWQYNIYDGECKTFEHFKEKGFQVLVSPWLKTDNMKALTNTAINKGLHGVLLTTWHALHEHINSILYSASIMWEGKNDASGRSTRQLDMSRTFTAAYQRKLCPVNGDYKKAGWRGRELDDGI